LEQCVVQPGDVIRSSARPGVAATQQPSECFARGVEICEQQVDPETAQKLRQRIQVEIVSVLAAFTLDRFSGLL